MIKDGLEGMRPMKQVEITLRVNGISYTVDIRPQRTLVEVLRETLGLTGTKKSCNEGECGACTVHMNGKAVKSCSMLAMQAEGAEIVTIEGVAKADCTLHPMQAAFKEHHGLQCGFCTPGMILATKQLLADHPNPTEQEIRHGLEGNLCRCTGYQHIVEAVEYAAKKLRTHKR